MRIVISSGRRRGPHSVGPFCSPASLATPEKPSVQMALAAGCEASPLLFSCFYRAVGRPKRQSCRVTTYGTCYEKISSERLNETVIFEGDRREQRRSMPTGPSWSNISKEANEPRCLRVYAPWPTAHPFGTDIARGNSEDLLFGPTAGFLSKLSVQARGRSASGYCSEWKQQCDRVLYTCSAFDFSVTQVRKKFALALSIHQTRSALHISDDAV